MWIDSVGNANTFNSFFSRFFKLPIGFSVHTSLGEGLEIYLATVKYHGLKEIHTCGYD